MQFTSYSYLVLLIPIVLVYWNLKPNWRPGYLLALSILFYTSWSIKFVLIPVAVCAGVFVCGSLMQKRPEKGRTWLWVGVSYVLSILIIFKYSHFFYQNVASIWPSMSSGPLSTLISFGLPLGISFYSFEAISYLIDARQRRVKGISISDLLLFVMFWPHLIAGPIVRIRELVPQFRQAKTFDTSYLVLGLDRIILGLVQKNVFANSIGSWVDSGFLENASRLNSTIDNWFLAIGFGLQIYFDFAAYSNIAIGVAQLLGIKLPENFNFPHYAENPSDFWSRWHMTLSRWVRDYLFFPINAKFKGAPLPLYTSLIGIMGLVGLWHGAGWGFVLWGLLHGTYLVVYRIWESLEEKLKPGKAGKWLSRQLWRGITLVAVVIAWVPFRAVSLAQTKTMLASMLFRFQFTISYSVNFYLITLLLVAVCVIEPWVFRILAWYARVSDSSRVGQLS